MNPRFPLLLALLPLLAACGAAKPVGSPTDAAAKPASSAAAKSAAAATPEDAPAKDPRLATPTPWTGEDPGKTVAIPGRYGWTIGAGDSWKIGRYEFVRAEGTKNVFLEFGGEDPFFVPAAYTFPATYQKDLKKGSSVLVVEINISTYGRVVSVTEDSVKVKTMFAGDMKEDDYTRDAVLLLDGKLGFGAPIAYKEAADDESWQIGILVYQDGKNAWLENGTKVSATQLRPLDVAKTYKVGDKVLAVPTNTLAWLSPYTITKVVDDGLTYEITGEEGNVEKAEFSSVTSPIK